LRSRLRASGTLHHIRKPEQNGTSRVVIWIDAEAFWDRQQFTSLPQAERALDVGVSLQIASASHYMTMKRLI
jgi:hypothetical protein